MSEVEINEIDTLNSSKQCSIPIDEEPSTKVSSNEDDTTTKNQIGRNVCANIHEMSKHSKAKQIESRGNKSNSSPEKHKRRSGGKKHRAGRNRKRKWKPYNKLTWTERKKLEERETRRAQRIRDEMSAAGLVLAPYNTTQFLMNDHNIQEPIYDRIVHNGHKHNESHHHVDTSDEEYYSGSNDEDYINQQFMEDYESYHDQYLDSLSKLELAQEWVRLEDQIEDVEKQLKQLQEHRRLLGLITLDPEAEMAKIQVFREEIEKLALENDELEKQNIELRNSLYGVS